MATNHAVNTWTLSGTRAEVVTAAMLLRGPNPRSALASSVRIQASCVLEEDGVIPPEFMELMESGLKTYRHFVRIDGNMASMDGARAAVDELDRCMAAGMKGKLLRDTLMPLIKPVPVQPVLRAGRQLFLYRTGTSVEQVVFTGIQPEPEVTLNLQRLIQDVRDSQLSMTGMLNMASHGFSDEEVGLTLPRDPDMKYPYFDSLTHGELIAKLGLLHYLVAPNGRYALGRRSWGCGSPLGRDSSQTIRYEMSSRKTVSPFMSLVNHLMSDRYSLQVEFSTYVRAANNAFNALCEALPEMEATARADMSEGGYSCWFSPEGIQMVTLEEDYTLGFRPDGPFAADKFDLEERLLETT